MSTYIEASNGYRVLVSKEGLFRMFPESILATALTFDPTADPIRIPRPIDYNILTELANVADTGFFIRPPWHLDETEVNEAANYLNMDLLRFANLARETSLWEISPIAYTNPENFDRVLQIVVEHHRDDLVQYLIRTAPDSIGVTIA